jgi:hypothetical protein
MGYKLLNNSVIITDSFIRIQSKLKYPFTPCQDLETLAKANLLLNKKLYTIKIEETR